MSADWSEPGRANSDVFNAADFSNSLDDELSALVKGELQPGERVLWAGRSRPPWKGPGVGSFLVGVVVVICLGFGAVNLAYGFGRPRFQPDDGSIFLGSSFCVIGSLLGIGLIGSTLNRRAERRQSASVCYAVTGRRAIIWVPEAKSDSVRVHTFPAGQIRNIVRVQRPDGSGDLEFSGAGSESYLYFCPPGFKGIPEVRRVEQIIRANLMTEVKGAQSDRHRTESVGDIAW